MDTDTVAPAIFGPDPSAPPPAGIPDPNAPVPAGVTWAQMFQYFNMMIAVNAAANAAPIITNTPGTPQPTVSSLPKAAKAPIIETYNGTSVKLLRPWLNRTRGILLMLGFDLNQPLTVTYAASFLTGPANSWFDSESARAIFNKESGGFATFDEFAHALSSKLGDPDPETKARDNLKRLHQTTSVKAYADEFQRIITYLPNRDAADLCYDFTSGLKYKIKELLVGHITTDMTWHDIRDLAYKYDDAVMSRRTADPPRYRDTNHPRDNRPNDPMDLNNTEARRGRSPHRSSSHHGRSPTPYSRPSGTSASLPKLTDSLREELRANNGCFRCRKHNAGHLARDCPGPAGISHRSPSPAPSRGRSPSPAKN